MAQAYIYITQIHDTHRPPSLMNWMEMSTHLDVAVTTLQGM